MNTAERIAYRFHNDGQLWRVAEGNRDVRILEVLAKERANRYTPASGRGYDSVRHEFPDGSAIVTTPGGWDVGFTNPSPGEPFECVCWTVGRQELAHAQECATRAKP